MEKRISEKLISIRNLSKEINGKKILKNISFDIVRGEITALLGPNGAGKTTILRCLTGIFNVTSGNIEKVNNLIISVMLEKDLLWEKYSGWENIKIYAELLGRGVEKNDIEVYAEKLGILDFLSQKVYTYSKGTKRKLSFLLALLKNPDLLVLDEPMSGLDPISRKNMRELILDLNQKGKSVILTSHDLGELEKLAHRVILIKEGKILVDDMKSEILGKYRDLEELFLDVIGGG
ncbi:ABC transporter ATP-binding protein [Dictyoglomus thermophilum]|jgi:ABC-2 type transport system ATP-binding protein|uniref:ABC transporter ATP-binding protein n=1 Tax=Dictyoglomus thermophilum (strain ATCC 35947 / DSM 3960 / H-6-12) TaxID=309799 RepID=B5YBZ6_DICT6|nr:ABC transporter ATP-binding protein [Dictyoglomus thermophilum]ACI18311.1 ABC transporter ATP-binding protein [Dictyoglomus thermophilum H-6-12]